MSCITRRGARQRGHSEASPAEESRGAAARSPIVRKSASVEPGVRLRLSRASNQKDWHDRQMSMTTGRPW